MKQSVKRNRGKVRGILLALSVSFGVSSCAFFGLSVLQVSGAEEAEYDRVAGEYLVQLKKESQNFDLHLLESSLGAKVLRNVRPDLIVVRRDNDVSMKRSIAAMENSEYVELVEPNAIYRHMRIPNDRDFGLLWGLKNSGQNDRSSVQGVVGMDVGAERAWDISTGSKDVVVAVIDTGVDFTHPELASNAWVNNAEKDGVEGVDDDANGFVDDVHGYDFVNNRGLMIDDNGHGTHVAGTIGAAGDNEEGVSGVAWNVSIMGIKFLSRTGSGTLENAVRAIDYSILMGAKISNNSWGGTFTSAILESALGRTLAAGQLFVAAAGNSATDNDRRPSIPAGYETENIVSVGALTNRGELASFSNFGLKSVDLAAPGHNIYSTAPGNKFATFSGTSMASPHVAGIAALIASENPNWSRAQIQQRLLTSARPLAPLRGKMVSAGTADAYYALTGETPPVDPNDPFNWTNRVNHSISSPHPYPDSYSETYTVHIPEASRISVYFSKFETQARADTVEFLDANGVSYGKMSGIMSNSYSPIVPGDTLVMKFVTNAFGTGYGFDLEHASFELAPTQPTEPTEPPASTIEQ